MKMLHVAFAAIYIRIDFHATSYEQRLGIVEQTRIFDMDVRVGV